jgi:hypothetical protein
MQEVFLHQKETMAVMVTQHPQLELAEAVVVPVKSVKLLDQIIVETEETEHQTVLMDLQQLELAEAAEDAEVGAKQAAAETAAAERVLTEQEVVHQQTLAEALEEDIMEAEPVVLE